MNYTKYFDGINVNAVKERVKMTIQSITQIRKSNLADVISQRSIWDSNSTNVMIEALEKNMVYIDATLHNLEVFSQVLDHAKKVKEIQEAMKSTTVYETQISYAEEIESLIKTISTMVNGMNQTTVVNVTMGTLSGSLTSTKGTTKSTLGNASAGVSKNKTTKVKSTKLNKTVSNKKLKGKTTFSSSTAKSKTTTKKDSSGVASIGGTMTSTSATNKTIGNLSGGVTKVNSSTAKTNTLKAAKMSNASAGITTGTYSLNARATNSVMGTASAGTSTKKANAIGEVSMGVIDDKPAVIAKAEETRDIQY